MKIAIIKYDPEWRFQFESISAELYSSIGFLRPHIEHIGSTSVRSLSAKPIIDILVGVEPQDIGETIGPLLKLGYAYYPVFNSVMPYRRFFIKHSREAEALAVTKIINSQEDIPDSTEEHDTRLAHIHVLAYNSEHWIRHIAFRDYLREHPEVLRKYQKLKERLGRREWRDGNEYNSAKDGFIKDVEKVAVQWYQDKMPQ